MQVENHEQDTVNVSEAVSTGDREESFASLLEKNDHAERRLSPGQKVKARVVSISGDLVYIDVGGKSEGTISLGEFSDGEGNVTIAEGDEIEAFFVSVQDGIRKLTTLINGYAPAKLHTIRDAHEGGIAINGEVKREVKGGFEVSAGGVRCFCPFSQIDLKGGREGGIYLGRTLAFKILEFGENGRNIVLSRRVLLEEEKKARIEQLKATLSVGQEVSGTVRSVQNFGAFMDLGGVDGLIPASELSWERTGSPKDILSEGQQVTAKIISLDWENNRLTLSLKALTPDPWSTVAEKYPVDGKISGTVVRFAPFGAFVNLEPGIDGLIHISNFGTGRRINHPREAVEIGQSVEAHVIAMDQEKRKISLSLRPKVQPKKIVLPEEGDSVGGEVEKVMPFGVFLRLSTGITGLIPNAEMGTPVGTDHGRMFPPGTEMQAVVMEVDSESKKIRLSRKAVIEKASRDEFQDYLKSAKSDREPVGGLGSLGDILRAKIEEKKANG